MSLLAAMLAAEKKRDNFEESALGNALGIGTGLTPREFSPPPQGLGAFASLFAPPVSSPPSSFNALSGVPTPGESFLGSLCEAPVLRPEIKRKPYFAFHFDDIMRVNNVRNAWKIKHPSSIFHRTFYDSSLWEDSKLTDHDALKDLIRQGVKYTSVVCVLIGTETWSRPWVRYEIARAVVDERGLLAVHINSLPHHARRTPDLRGCNPLQLMGIYKDEKGRFYLYEAKRTNPFLFGDPGWQWEPYSEYRFAVSLPKYLPEPSVGYVMPLSAGAREYDFYCERGHTNIGAWIDEAASAVDR